MYRTSSGVAHYACVTVCFGGLNCKVQRGDACITPRQTPSHSSQLMHPGSPNISVTHPSISREGGQGHHVCPVRFSSWPRCTVPHHLKDMTAKATAEGVPSLLMALTNLSTWCSRAEWYPPLVLYSSGPH